MVALSLVGTVNNLFFNSVRDFMVSSTIKCSCIWYVKVWARCNSVQLDSVINFVKRLVLVYSYPSLPFILYDLIEGYCCNVNNVI